MHGVLRAPRIACLVFAKTAGFPGLVSMVSNVCVCVCMYIYIYIHTHTHTRDSIHSVYILYAMQSSFCEAQKRTRRRDHAEFSAELGQE